MTPVNWVASMHWSFASRAWCGFIGIAEDGRAIVRHELVTREKTPEQAALLIYRAMMEHGIPSLDALILPAEVFPDKIGEGGETVSETFAKASLPVVKGDEQIKAGWMRLRAWLTPVPHRNGDVGPSLLIHADCKRLRRTLPTIVSSDTDADTIIETPDAFPVHALRRFVMSRPLPREQAEPPLPVGAVGHLVRELRESVGRD